MAANEGKTDSSGESLYSEFRDQLAGMDSSILQGKNSENPVCDFARSTLEGLTVRPRRLEYRFLYDAQGSALFDRITEQPEYYLTRTEAGILQVNAERIRATTGPVTLVELGSGSAEKTGCLLRAWLSRGETACYVPVDVSLSALRKAGSNISRSLAGVRVIGVNTDYYGAFPLFREVSPVMVLFLGSSIGNFAPREMEHFFASMAAALSPDDFFLLGIDLVKQRHFIEAAYNDKAGVTAEFTRNLFARMNRELRSGIDLSAVEHVAEYNPQDEQIEIFARFARRQQLRIEPLERVFDIAEGEMIRIEISRKFLLRKFIPYLEKFGFTTSEVFTDQREWFALILLRRTAAISG